MEEVPAFWWPRGARAEHRCCCQRRAAQLASDETELQRAPRSPAATVQTNYRAAEAPVRGVWCHGMTWISANTIPYLDPAVFCRGRRGTWQWQTLRSDGSRGQCLRNQSIK